VSYNQYIRRLLDPVKFFFSFSLLFLVGSVTTSEFFKLCVFITTHHLDDLEFTTSYISLTCAHITYDQSLQKIRDPVRSPLVKLKSAGLVVGSVTTSESPVLYVVDIYIRLPFVIIRSLPLEIPLTSILLVMGQVSPLSHCVTLARVKWVGLRAYGGDAYGVHRYTPFHFTT
jgi:hypothetical protein